MNQNNCTKSCSTCNTTCISKCPICEKSGKIVKINTVRNLIRDKSKLKTGDVYICINRKCDCVYYQPASLVYFLKNEIKKPIWFKSTINDYIVCYCHNIKLLDIINIIGSMNEMERKNLSKELIFKKLGYDINNRNCENNFPDSSSCDILFSNAITYALSYLNKKNNID